MFFAYNGGRGKVYHVGMYIGNGQMLHAPNSVRKLKSSRTIPAFIRQIMPVQDAI